jgi:iron complex outermembrane receptor protein
LELTPTPLNAYVGSASKDWPPDKGEGERRNIDTAYKDFIGKSARSLGSGEDKLVRNPTDMRRRNSVARAYRFGFAAVSTIAMAAAWSSPSWAQEAQDAPVTDPQDAPVTDPETEIVVTGIRHGLAQSLDLKKDELSIVEVVSAEEIGKLPDVSIAESIARLPGLTAQRVGGRAQVISIRGMAPDFSTTLLNGRQQASSGDNRGVEFDQYPSELLSGVVIYKTPDADISGMGLSGTVDLRTVRPLTFGRRAIAFNIRGELTSGKKLNDDVRNYGGRVSASYIDQNDAGTLGWAIGFAHLDAPSQNRHYKAYNYETFSGTQSGHGHVNRDIKTFINPDTADNANFLSGTELFAYSRLNKRDAAIAILEWEPSDSVHLTLDTYYSKFKQRETMRGAQWFMNPFFNFFGPGGAIGTPDQVITNATVIDYGGTPLAETGQITNIAPILRNDYNTRDDELFSIGLNNEFNMTDKLRFIADLSYSSNKRDESVTETYAGAFSGATPTRNSTNYISDGVSAGRAFDTISWDLNGLGGFPTFGNGLNYADASRISLGDRDPWGGWGHDGQTKEPHVKEDVFALDLGFEYDLEGFFDSFDIGVNFTKRAKDKRVDEFDLFLKNGRAQTLVDPSLLVDPTSLGFAGFGDVLAVNLPEALPRYYDRSVFINNDTFNKAWSIDEEVLTLRAKATIDWGNLRGNIGVQVVEQRQQSEGSAINATVTPRVVTPVNDGASYTDILPSMNLIYDLGGGHRLRLAAAEVLARPRMDDLRASFIPSFNVNICSGSQPCVPGQTVNPWSGTGGNAKLEPWRAKALDVAYEWYLGRASYISVAAFYKKLDNYIFTQRQPFDFAGLPIPPAALAPGKIPPGVIVSSIGQINQPANGTGGSIKGIEISGALEFGKLTSLLDGFGVIGSYSYTKSNLHPQAPTFNAAGEQTNKDAVQATRIPGLSGTVYNITGYFEKWGFQARASYRYRSAFKGEVTALFAARGVTEILAEKDVSAQVGYNFQPGSSLEGLGILFQVNNLTDSRYATRLGTDSGGKKSSDGSFFLQDYEKYGRQFLFGVSYRY